MNFNINDPVQKFSLHFWLQKKIVKLVPTLGKFLSFSSLIQKFYFQQMHFFSSPENIVKTNIEQNNVDPFR